jgi:hypothetical protein
VPPVPISPPVTPMVPVPTPPATLGDQLDRRRSVNRGLAPRLVGQRRQFLVSLRCRPRNSAGPLHDAKDHRPGRTAKAGSNLLTAPGKRVRAVARPRPPAAGRSETAVHHAAKRATRASGLETRYQMQARTTCDIVSAYGGQLWLERPSRVRSPSLAIMTRPGQGKRGAATRVTLPSSAAPSRSMRHCVLIRRQNKYRSVDERLRVPPSARDRASTSSPVPPFAAGPVSSNAVTVQW